MYYVFYVIGAFNILLGGLIWRFVLTDLVAGVNTMTPLQKRKVNHKAVARLIGLGLIAMGVFSIIGGALMTYHETAGILLAILSIFIFVMVMVTKVQKYDGNNFNSDGTMKKSAKITVITVNTISLLIMISITISILQ